jgi:ZIP family zinc transporter
VTDALAVLGAASLAVAASACGVLPVALRRTFDRAWIGLGSGVAGGVMLAVSAGLLVAGASRDAGLAAAGTAAGLAFVGVLRRVSRGAGEVEVAGLAGVGGRRALLIVTVLTLHSAAEGIGLGSSFAGSAVFGVTIALALAVHKLPEGLAVGLVLVPQGVRPRAAAGFAALAAAPLLVLAVPGFLFVDAFEGLLPAALGFAAGAMALVVLAELVPEAVRHAPPRRVLVYGGFALTATIVFESAMAAAA